METKVEEISINSVTYVPKESVAVKAEKMDGLEYVIVRTYSAGVFAGYLKKKEGQEVTLLKARRIWFWDGAASLSQLAMEGTQKPNNCKFPQEVEKVGLWQAIEIIDCTEKARKSIQGVPIWKQ